MVNDLYNTDLRNVVSKKYYKNILCYYNFKTVNNKGIIYDESSYTNFLERLPKTLVK